MTISAILPAYNEQEQLPLTILSLRQIEAITEVIVVDDGSQDETATIACEFADRVISLPLNRGKGEALRQGTKYATGEILLFLDSDLGASVHHIPLLLDPLLRGEADMCIAIFPPAATKGGFGLVKGLARGGLYRLTGFQTEAPLSGQRALTKQAATRVTDWNVRFGIEVGMTIDLLRAGLRIVEVPIPLTHRETKRNVAGFVHRGKQFIDVGRMLGKKWLSR